MLVLLDRDGVINEDLPHGVTCLEEFRFIPGAPEALAALTRAGFSVAVVTNQSGVAKNLLTQETLESIHRYMCEQVEKAGGRIDALYICTDHPDRPTSRRKPAPGMLHEALMDFGATAAATPYIGDACRDMEAATAAGCPAILVRTGKGHFTLNKGLPGGVQPRAVVEDCTAAAHYVIRHFRQGAPE